MDMISFRSPADLMARLEEYSKKYHIPKSNLVRHAIAALLMQLDQTDPIITLPPDFEVKIQIRPKKRSVSTENIPADSPMWNEESSKPNYGDGEMT